MDQGWTCGLSPMDLQFVMGIDLFIKAPKAYVTGDPLNEGRVLPM